MSKGVSSDRLNYSFPDFPQDLFSSIADISQFLGKQLTDDVITKITNHCTFESMRQNPMTNHEDVYSINKDISPLLRKGLIDINFHICAIFANIESAGRKNKGSWSRFDAHRMFAVYAVWR